MSRQEMSCPRTTHQTYVVNLPTLIVREEPRMQSVKVATLSGGTEVQVRKEVTNDDLSWYAISLDPHGFIGWIPTYCQTMGVRTLKRNTPIQNGG
jgi:hypothetical protein